mmetsp:Transcript_24239/g.51167  ORF Transcript_24239/g.51167 Transcript_24239/m.51167 type:complete len:105 (-) Transcript_24239:858-1172(-)
MIDLHLERNTRRRILHRAPEEWAEHKKNSEAYGRCHPNAMAEASLFDDFGDSASREVCQNARDCNEGFGHSLQGLKHELELTCEAETGRRCESAADFGGVVHSG